MDSSSQLTQSQDEELGSDFMAANTPKPAAPAPDGSTDQTVSSPSQVVGMEVDVQDTAVDADSESEERPKKRARNYTDQQKSKDVNQEGPGEDECNKLESRNDNEEEQKDNDDGGAKEPNAVETNEVDSDKVNAKITSQVKEDELNEPPNPKLQRHKGLLEKLEDCESVFPDSLAHHFLHAAGFESTDPRIAHIITLAAQKHLLDILKSAHTISKAKAAAAATANATSTSDGAPEADGESTTARKPGLVLDMEDLEAAARDHGISIPKPYS